ncbi:c-type cytochrome [Methyloferula stellata]|uniref:c-type cytochrome n=1 Tax=Methyloferula stellata TaxID=876270 RepID=UPI00035E2BBB|nr:cytochrome c [Methyloferula stellata]
MLKIKFAAIAAVLSLTGTAVYADGSAANGAQKIKTFGCITCHGRDGVSKLAEAPNLAGQVQIYLTSALQAYRTGGRKNEMMNTVAEKLTDSDIADLATYYSSIAVSVAPPPRP